MQIAIIGTGFIGGTLGRALAKPGTRSPLVLAASTTR